MDGSSVAEHWPVGPRLTPLYTDSFLPVIIILLPYHLLHCDLGHSGTVGELDLLVLRRVCLFDGRSFGPLDKLLRAAY